MSDEHLPDESVEPRDDPSSLLAQLVAECLDRVAEEGTGAVEVFCQEHGEHAEAIRRRIEALQQVGLLEFEPSPEGEFPEEIGPFHLIRRLGTGGMGVVYLAEQEPLGRTVALKLMRPDQVFFQGSRQRFQREILAVARLHHPGIVSVHTAGEEGGIPYFAMEFVRGCSLSDALTALRGREPSDLSAPEFLRTVAESSPPEEDDQAESVQLTEAAWTDVCLRLVLQVAEALAHAHQKGIHHRDIKPSNVMVTRSGRAMLLDFGLASASGTSRMTHSGSQLGSLPYMAPESLEGGPAEDGAAADVYSLGVTLYELLTLHSPFLDENPSVTIRKVLQAEPDPVRLRHPGVSWAAETVCGKAMDRDPSRRYASAEEFARDLQNALENRPILARRPGPILRVQRWSRRHPARAVAVVGATLLLAASVTYGVLQSSTNRALTLAGETKDKALSELETRNAELDAALAEVDASFGRVVDSGIRMLSRVGFDILQNVPLSDSVRRDLLDESQRLAEVLQRDAPDDPHLRFEMARTLRLLGEFRGDMGEYAQGEVHLQQAVEILTGLVAEQPDQEGALNQLVRTYHGLGSSFMQRFESAKAAEAFQSGAAAGADGLKKFESSDVAPSVMAEFRTVTAMNLQAAGVALRFLSRLEDADHAFQGAREQLSLIPAGFHEEQQETLAACCINHSTVLVALGKEQEAHEALRAGIDVYQGMLKIEPGNAGIRTNMGRAMEYLAGLLPDGSLEALSLAEDAVETLRIAHRDSPGSTEAAQGLSGALEGLGSEQKRRGLYKEARASLEEALQILGSLRGGQSGGVAEQFVILQTRLAEVLALSGDFLQAEDTHRTAVANSDPWIDDQSSDLERRTYAVVALESFSRFLSDNGMPEEALPHARRSLEESRRQIEARPDDPRMIAQLSTTAILTSRIELELGHAPVALELLESILDAVLNDEELLQAAGLASRCIEEAGEDAELADLAAAVGLAFLDQLADPALLDSEGTPVGVNLDPLKARPEFGAWSSGR